MENDMTIRELLQKLFSFFKREQPHQSDRMYALMGHVAWLRESNDG